MFKKILNICLLLNLTNIINAHGRLDDPPSRNTAWRFYEGFPINYDDNGLSSVDSICGNKMYEIGYGYKTNGNILRIYYSGQIITIYSVITANHLGSIEISVCNIDNPDVEATQECLNKHKLEVITYYRKDKLNKYRALLFENDQEVKYQVKLPDSFSCERCVLQWRWFSLNTGEEFKNCADIAIMPETIENNIMNNEFKTTKFASTSKDKKSTKKSQTTKKYRTKKNNKTQNFITSDFLTTHHSILESTINLNNSKNSETTFSTQKYHPNYACSNHPAPPITIFNKNKIFNGLMVICFKSKIAVTVNCELCKKLCIEPEQKCPLDQCECRWY